MHVYRAASFITLSMKGSQLLTISVWPFVCLSICLSVKIHTYIHHSYGKSYCLSVCLSVQYIYVKHESSNIQYITKSETIQNHLETKEINTTAQA